MKQFINKWESVIGLAFLAVFFGAVMAMAIVKGCDNISYLLESDPYNELGGMIKSCIAVWSVMLSSVVICIYGAIKEYRKTIKWYE